MGELAQLGEGVFTRLLSKSVFKMLLCSFPLCLSLFEECNAFNFSKFLPFKVINNKLPIVLGTFCICDPQIFDPFSVLINLGAS